MDSYKLNSTIMSLHETKFIFPTLSYKKEHIPVGNSIPMCMSVVWSKRGMQAASQMKQVEGFPNCSQSLTGKFIWNENDTKLGVDIPVWKQYINEAGCSDAECDEYCRYKYNGYFVNGYEKHVCYSYEVLKSVCIVIKYDSDKNIFNYEGGCFKDGLPYQMEKAQMGKVYYFDDVEVSVKNGEDPIIVAGKMSNYSYSFGSSWRYVAYFLNVVLVANIALLGYTIYLIFNERKIGKRGMMEEKQDN